MIKNRTAVFFYVLIFFLVPVTGSSYGKGTAPFSPTVPVQKVVKNTNPESKTATLFADSAWTAPPMKVNPSKAMFHSLVLPGWGQLNNGKKKKAALVIAAELICIGGYIYENHRVKHDTVSEWERDNIRTDRNTFIIYWLATKLFVMVDAYVDAQLSDYDVRDITPGELQETGTEKKVK